MWLVNTSGVIVENGVPPRNKKRMRSFSHDPWVFGCIYCGIVLCHADKGYTIDVFYSD